MKLKHWPILKPLKSYFLKTVQAALVFGNGGSEALLVTRDNCVYGIGTNLAGHLGLGDESPRTTITEIPTLSGKGVRGFAYGGDLNDSGKLFVVAYLDNGQIYQWGLLPYSEIPLLVPNLVCTLDSKVTEVACGYTHFVALCDNGKVYSWGTNEKGQLGREVNIVEGNDEKLPKVYGADQVKGILDGKMVIQVACGAQFTLALVNNGQVVSWGCNEQKQLGLSVTSGSFFTFTPTITKINNIPEVACKGTHAFVITPTIIPTINNIRKVACGRTHAMALHQDSYFLHWGSSRPFSRNLMEDTPIGTPKSQTSGISDISASYLFDFIVVIFKKPDNYNTSTVYGPTPITIGGDKYCSLFEFYCQQVSFMQQTMYPPEIHRILMEFIEHAFENQKYCDMIIEVDGKEFHVHRTILMMRSKYFETIISRWLDPKINVCSIKEKSPAAIEAYLKYIYTDKLDVDLTLATELLLLADEYDDEDFKILCKQVIEQKMTVDSVVELYPLVYRMRNVEDLIDRSIEIVASKRSYLETIVNSDGYKNWNPEMLQMFLPRYAKRRRLDN